MLTAIIGHPARTTEVVALQRALPGSVVFLDDGTLGAAGNHHRAMRFAAERDEPLLVIEDDAILTGRIGDVGSWIARFPDRLISFYLGTGHPPAWQPSIAELLTKADQAGRDYIELSQLIHGVCYYVPTPRLIVDLIDMNSGASDQSIGDAWSKATGLMVIYPTTSLVDHPDLTSIDKDAAVLAIMDPRHAWRLP